MSFAHTRLGSLCAALVMVVAAGGATVMLPPSEVAAAPQPIEVHDLKTETSTTYRNPDGSYTLEQHLNPIRVRKPDGWVDIDTDLHRASSGRIEPAATTQQVSFSGGGEGPMATIGERHEQLSLSWPAPLPDPVLDGATVTYPDVLPEVDLKLKAHDSGFSQVLVVKSRAAARNPALRSLQFDLKADGLTVERNDAGAMEAVDENGKAVFAAPAPIMWDSGSNPEHMAPRGLARSANGLAKARQARLGVDLSATKLTLEADTRLLDALDTTYPIYIDPSWTGKRNNWTSVWKQFPSTSY